RVCIARVRARARERRNELANAPVRVACGPLAPGLFHPSPFDRARPLLASETLARRNARSDDLQERSGGSLAGGVATGSGVTCQLRVPSNVASPNVPSFTFPEILSP